MRLLDGLIECNYIRRNSAGVIIPLCSKGSRDEARAPKAPDLVAASIPFRAGAARARRNSRLARSASVPGSSRIA